MQHHHDVPSYVRLCPRPALPPSPLRAHLTLAAEARQRGDYGAAEMHETDALRALRAQIAEVRQ